MKKNRDSVADAVAAVADILRRGNDAEVRKRGDGYIVLEVKRAIKYST